MNTSIAAAPTAPATIVPQNAEHAERIAAALEALAGNTRRAYGFAFASWRQFADANEVDPLEPPPAIFRLYIKERAARGSALSTLRLAAAALRKVQALAGAQPTASDPMITDTLSGIVKDEENPPPPAKQVGALTGTALAAIRATACNPRIGRRGVLETADSAEQRGLADLALAQTMSDAGLRRSEAAALTWADIEQWPDGSGRLTIRRSKTDVDPRTAYVTPRAMKDLEAIQPEEPAPAESVFGLSVSTISRRIKAAAANAGLGAAFSGHSGRVGMARRMALAGAPTHEIMAQGRWRSPQMVATYTRGEEAGRAAQWLQ